MNRHVMRAVPGLAKAAVAIENLWKARVEGEAKDDADNIVGAVWYLDGVLTWFCENSQEEALCRR